MSEEKLTQVTTPKFRVSFPQVDVPKAYRGGKELYSIVMLFDKPLKAEGKLTDMLNLIKAAAMEKWGEIPGEILDMSLDTCPFNDGDLKAYDGYTGTYSVRAASQFPPVIVDTGNIKKNIKPQAILGKEEFYSGCYARASVTAFAWGKKYGDKGISFGLQNIQKLADGEPFSGRGDPLADFDPIVPEEVEVADTEDLFEGIKSNNHEYERQELHDRINRDKDSIEEL